MLKAIHAQEDREAAMEKAKAVETKLASMRLSRAARSSRRVFTRRSRIWPSHASTGRGSERTTCSSG